MVTIRRSLVHKDPAKLNGVLRDIKDSTAYAHLLEKPGGWVAPSAVVPLAPLSDGLPGNASAATVAEGLGKGGKGAYNKKDLKKTAARRDKDPKGAGTSEFEGA